MNHGLYAEGYGLRLRPVRMEDAGFIVWLEHSRHAKGKRSDSPADVESEQAWLKEYFDRAGDYYFMIQTLSGMPVGTLGLYNLAGTVAEAGRWVIRPGVPAAVPSAMLGCLIALEMMGLSHVCCRVAATEQAVLSLAHRLGFHLSRIELAALPGTGKPVDLVHLVYSAPDWPACRPGLLAAARVSEKRIREWERAQAPATPAPELSSSAVLAAWPEYSGGGAVCVSQRS